MENIIKRAIEGGWKPFTGYLRKKFEIEEYYAIFYDKVNVRRFAFSDMVLDPLFWQALGKACGWNPHKKISDVDWIDHALHFHKINLTEGWEPAVKYLSDLVK